MQMYANPNLAEPLLKKIRQLAVTQSKLPRGSLKWQMLDEIKRDLYIEWAKLRLQKDPSASTYK